MCRWWGAQKETFFFFLRLWACASLSALSRGHKDNSDNPFIFLTSCRLQEKRWLLPRLFMVLLISHSYIFSSLLHTYTHIPSLPHHSSLHLQQHPPSISEHFLSMVYCFYPFRLLWFVHILKRQCIYQVSEKGQSQAWESSQAWSTMLLVSIWNRLLRRLKPFSEERFQQEL